ncbi:MAG: sulfatase-like hydrolase/transferase [Bacteroidales bacterium]|nr:sulfatase-like hydrolase/transferase [Bacteroidales bacterium]
MRNTLLFNDFIKTALRIFGLYIAFFLCRIFFYFYNINDLGAISLENVWRLLHGSLVFDSASIFYINLPFLLLSLLPLPFKSSKGYRILLWSFFLIVNGIGLIINIADIFYYPFKLARIASDDLHFFTEEGIGSILGYSILDYWYALPFFLSLICWLLFVLYKTEKITATPFKKVSYYFIYVFFIAATAGVSIVLIRGGVSKATFPMQMSDASFYASPKQASLVLSNPFCLIRTIKKETNFPTYYDETELNRIYRPQQAPVKDPAVQLPDSTNVVLLILESFGSGHSSFLSKPDVAGSNNHTPFLDSLYHEGLVFTNAFQNGIRSMDALPAIWGSIPSFKSEFLSLPYSIAAFRTLPTSLQEMGYFTAFLHGATRKTMSFVAFSELCGVDHFYMLEEYEKERGKEDYNGYWGIHDDKFLDYTADKLNTFPQPFFATIFTLSSHHPNVIPQEYEQQFKEGSQPIHRAIEYSDFSLRLFFDKIKHEPWYKNTLFILTADHGSRGEAAKFQSSPYNYAVPIFFYYPGNKELLKGEMDGIAQHIDIFPTILNMLGYPRPHFGFGNDLLNTSSNERFAFHYFGNGYNCLTDDRLYLFNEKEVTGIYAYKDDPLLTQNLLPEGEEMPPLLLEQLKARLQQYGEHLHRRDYLPH